MSSRSFKKISESYYWQWLLYGIAALISISVFPNFSLGWICLNFIIFHFFSAMSIVMHELGHAIAAFCLGMKVTGVTIGYGETVREFQSFGMVWKINQVPECGAMYALDKSTYFYRFRQFIVSLSGPLTHVIAMLLVLKFPLAFFTAFNSPTAYFFPGIILFLVNFRLFFSNLYPREVDIYGVTSPNDSLRMLQLPFLSERSVAEEVAICCASDGCILANSGEYRLAIECFSQAIKYNSDYIEAYRWRGYVYQKIEEKQKAIDDYQLAIYLFDSLIELENFSSANYYFRATVYLDWMKIDSTKSQPAIADLSKAISLQESSADKISADTKSLYCARAAIYCYLGLETQAIEDFTKAIELGADVDAYYNRGVTYYQFERYQAAIDDLDVAIGFDKNSISAYYSRGNAKYALQDRTGAFEDYERAEFLISIADIHPADEHGFYARGIAYIRLENKVKALENLQQAESLCLEHVNTSLLAKIKQELETIED